MAPTLFPPVITLTTDFGLADHYVGTMKGVLVSRCPGAQLVDITHDVPAFSIWAGAYAIDQSAPYFPHGTVHLVVIDPGVGTDRRPLVVEALEQRFVGPDNGVFSLILERDPNARIYEITNDDLLLPSPSATFHGRDIFAPVAAALASGSTSPSAVGPLITNVERLADTQPVQQSDGLWHGKILSIDHFGNVITNLSAHRFLPILTPRFSLQLRKREIFTLGNTFGEMEDGELFVYAGSSGYLEIGASRDKAAEIIGVEPGQLVTLRL